MTSPSRNAFGVSPRSASEAPKAIMEIPQEERLQERSTRVGDRSLSIDRVGDRSRSQGFGGVDGEGVFGGDLRVFRSHLITCWAQALECAAHSRKRWNARSGFFGGEATGRHKWNSAAFRISPVRGPARSPDSGW